MANKQSKYLFEEVEARLDKVSELETELGTKANSADVYTKTEVDKAIADAALEGGDVNLDDYYTKTEVDDLIPETYDDTELSREVFNLKTALDDKADKTELDGLATEAFVADGTDGAKGDAGYSPTVTENADNTDEIYKLDITTETESYTTPNLIGKQGAQGIQGEKGLQGEKGDTGAAGEDGESPTVTENADNTSGVYKLDITTADGTFTTPNLVGAQGIQGIQGEKGDPGERGEQGIQGIQGIPGEKGADGYPFLIYKEYTSLDEFDAADFPEIGLMFMVKTEGADSQPIYRYTGEADTPYSHITDMATTEGLKGEKGDKGDTGEQGIQGEKGDPVRTALPISLSLALLLRWTQHRMQRSIFLPMKQVRVQPSTSAFREVLSVSKV